MDTKTCSMCNVQKLANSFYKKYSECKDCNRARVLERYYDNKDKTSNQQKKITKKTRDKALLKKQISRCIQIRDLVRSYVELGNRLKAMEEKLGMKKHCNHS